MTSEPITFGSAVDLLVKNPGKYRIYRAEWHGKQLGYEQYIVFKTIQGITIFVFHNKGVEYAWNPSHNDMMSSDWIGEWTGVEY